MTPCFIFSESAIDEIFDTQYDTLAEEESLCDDNNDEDVFFPALKEDKPSSSDVDKCRLTWQRSEYVERIANFK